MNPPIAPRRVFEDLHGVAPSARCLSDDVIAAFADPVLSSSNEQLDSLLPSRGIVFGSIFELFGSAAEVGGGLDRYTPLAEASGRCDRSRYSD